MTTQLVNDISKIISQLESDGLGAIAFFVRFGDKNDAIYQVNADNQVEPSSLLAIRESSQFFIISFYSVKHNPTAAKMHILTIRALYAEYEFKNLHNPQFFVDRCYLIFTEIVRKLLECGNWAIENFDLEIMAQDGETDWAGVGAELQIKGWINATH